MEDYHEIKPNKVKAGFSFENHDLLLGALPVELVIV